ncbi:MAG TPA: IS4 family transposase [Methylophaga sp.]|nr:IS4 family transposase [Methylophaga sp.]
MSVQSLLSDLVSSDYYPQSVSVFAEHIPHDCLQLATQHANQVTVRRRKLVSEYVLWLVVGMAFFRNEPLIEIARRMNISLDGQSVDTVLAKSALTQARQKLGSESMAWLFRHSGEHWATERYPDDTWQGLQVFAIDGALFRTADTPELRDHFGSGNTGSDRQTPYPLCRVVTVMNVHSHVLLDAQINSYRTNEMKLASDMLDKLPDNSITLLDKGFFSAALLHQIHDKGHQRHWLLPMRKSCKYEVVADYGDGDQLIEMHTSPAARKQHPELPDKWQARAVTYQLGQDSKTVLTSLPADHFEAKTVAALYHQRWQIELGFRDIKSSMQHNALTLRSKTVEWVCQELWGSLLAYNLIRREASLAAVSHGYSPDDVSFKFACQFITAELINMAVAVSPANTPKRLKNLRGNIAILFLKKRPRPSRPRAVKMSKTRYPVNYNASPLK